MAYQAFLSYSHAADGKLSPAIQEALHHFAKGWYQLRAIRVFRDQTSLSANPELWGAIQDALAQSGYFLLMASPLSAQSVWVQREIQWWLANRSTGKILVLLTDGELVWDPKNNDFDWMRTTALSPSLAGCFAGEPLYVDFRWAHSIDHLSLRHSQFRAGILDLAATIRGIPKDELDGDDVRQHRRTRQVVTAGILGLLVFAVVAAWQAYAANVSRLQEVQQRHRADLSAVEAGRQRDVAVQREREAKEQREIAEQRRIEAERQARIARSRELAVGAIGQVDKDPELGLLLAVEGGKVDRTPESEEALRRSLLSSHLRRILGGHKERVTASAFTPDSRRVATLGWDGLAIVWNLSTGKKESTVQAGAGITNDVCFSPDGRFLVTADNLARVRVWDASSGHELTEIGNSGFLAISHDSKWLLTDSLSQAAIWDLTTGKKVHDLTGHAAFIKSAAVSPDDNLIATADDEGVVLVWDAKTAKVVTKVSGGFPSFNSNGKTLATTENSGAHLWATDTGKILREIPIGAYAKAKFNPAYGHLLMIQGAKSTQFWDLAVNEIKFELPESGLVYSPNGLFVGNTEGIWDAQTGDKAATLYGPEEVVAHSMVFSPDGRSAATTYDDGTARVWSTGPHATVVDLQVPQLKALMGLNPVDLPAFSPDGSRMFAGLRGVETTNIASWDLKTGHLLWSVPAHKGEITHLVSSPDGKLFVSAGKDMTARVWDSTGRAVATLTGHTSWVEDAQFSSNSNRIVTQAYDGTARVWEPGSGKLLLTLLAKGGVFCASFSPDARMIVTGGDKVARIWDASSGKMIREISGLKGAVQAFFSPSGSYLATSGGGPNGDATLRVHDAATGRVLAVIPKTQGATFGPDETLLMSFEEKFVRVRDWRLNVILAEFAGAEYAQWSPGGQFVLTSNKFGEVRVWNARTGRAMMNLPGTSNAGTSARFSPDGQLIMVSDLLGTRIYGCDACAPFDRLLSLAAGRTTRQLSAAERRIYLHEPIAGVASAKAK